MRLLNKNPKVEQYFIKFDGDELRIKKVLATKIDPRLTIIVDGFIIEHGRVVKRGTVEYMPRIFHDGNAVIIKNCVVTA